MNKKYNIGVSENCNLITFLQKDFNIITDPYLYYGDNIDINFDKFLMFNESEPPNITKELKLIDEALVIGSPRYDKYKQKLIFDKLKINSPKTYYSGNNHIEVISQLLMDYKLSDEIIIKPTLGARGIGQFKSKIGAFYDGLNNGVKNSTMGLECNLGVQDSEYKTYGEDNIKNGKYIVCEVIKPISEYRWVQFYGEEPIIIKRNLDKGWQANVSKSGIGVKVSPKDIIGYEEIILDINLMMDFTNSPFMGFDIYHDGDKHGFFEFQSEMGFQAMLPHMNEFISKLNKGLTNKILTWKN